MIRLHSGDPRTSEPVAELPLTAGPPWVFDAATTSTTIDTIDGFTLYDSDNPWSAEHIFRVDDGKATHVATVQPSRWARLHWWLCWPARRWMR